MPAARLAANAHPRHATCYLAGSVKDLHKKAAGRTPAAFRLSERLDSNQRPLPPQGSALTKLSYAPLLLYILIRQLPPVNSPFGPFPITFEDGPQFSFNHCLSFSKVEVATARCHLRNPHLNPGPG